MSSRIFKPSQAGKQIDCGSRYKPGVKVDCKPADELFGLFQDDTLAVPFNFAHLSEDNFKDAVGLVRSCIEPFECELEHHDVVLDRLVMRLHQENPYLQKVSNLFSALAQALYGLEYNDILVDLSPLTAFNDSKTLYRLGNEFGKYLRGADGNPLRLECRGNFSDVCEESKYCAVVLKGTSVNVATSADKVAITSLGPTGFAGAHAVECELYVQSEDSVVRNGWKNTFYVSDGVTEKFLRHLKKPLKTAVGEKDFFERGNRIVVPDGLGGWAEVGR